MFTVHFLRLIISLPGRQCFFDIERLHLLLRPNATHSILSLESLQNLWVGWHRSPIAFTSVMVQFSSTFLIQEPEGPCDLSPPLCPSVGCTLKYGIASSMEGKNGRYRLKTSGGAYSRGSTAKQVAAGLKINFVLRKNQCCFGSLGFCEEILTVQLSG